MANNEHPWIDAVKETDIEAGDEVTVVTTSEVEEFDDTATVTAAAEPTDYWLHIETDYDCELVVVPANDDHEEDAVLWQCSAIRATGELRNAKRVAGVDGIEEVA